LPGLPGQGSDLDTVLRVPNSRYDSDPLAAGNSRARTVLPRVGAERDLVVEDVETGFCGAVVRVEKMPQGVVVELEDRHGRRRSFPLGAGFHLDGQPVELVRPSTQPAAPFAGARTASGSRAVANAPAKVALASRIYVEGRHDAELVERVWGDDLRDAGVVVEYLGGIDDLAGIVAAFSPGPGRRLGVLVDHLVPGSKEDRIAKDVMASVRSAHVLIVGHPYVDVWQSVRPASLGIAEWPQIPPGQPWKEGVIAALGWEVPSHEAWRRILAGVNSYADLEPALLGRVEELIDFVTAGT
jgi:Protein of unknown function (DUF3097)